MPFLISIGSIFSKTTIYSYLEKVVPLFINKKLHPKIIKSLLFSSKFLSFSLNIKLLLRSLKFSSAKTNLINNILSLGFIPSTYMDSVLPTCIRPKLMSSFLDIVGFIKNDLKLISFLSMDVVIVTLALISVLPVLPNLLKNFSLAFHKYNSL